MNSKYDISKWAPPGLHEFDINRINIVKQILFVLGKRDSGKSTLIKNILFHFRNQVRKVFVMSGSEDANHFYETTAIPITFIKGKLDIALLHAIFNLQKEFQEPCLLILDDLSFEKALKKDPTLIEILFKGRHFNMGLIFAAQYLIHIPLDLRTSYDFAFVFGDNNGKNQDRLFENFFSFVSNAAEFRKIFRYFTSNRRVLVADGAASSFEIDECMYYFKSKKITGVFHVGCTEYRAFYSADQKENYKISEFPEPPPPPPPSHARPNQNPCVSADKPDAEPPRHREWVDRSSARSPDRHREWAERAGRHREPRSPDRHGQHHRRSPDRHYYRSRSQSPWRRGHESARYHQ